jgi:hypothetical protein
LESRHCREAILCDINDLMHSLAEAFPPNNRNNSRAYIWAKTLIVVGGRLQEAWIPERSATCLREADLNVLSKLGNQGLEWRLEPEAFTRREVRREDDLLDILVGCPIDIQVAWQPLT